MGSQIQTDNLDHASGSEEYPKARRENGTFILPWKGRLAGALNVAKWFLTSPNNSNIPRRSEVKHPYFTNINFLVCGNVCYYHTVKQCSHQFCEQMVLRCKWPYYYNCKWLIKISIAFLREKQLTGQSC